MTTPASPQPGNRDERESGLSITQTGSNLRIEPPWPSPSAGQEQLRDEIARAYARWTAAPYEPDQWQADNGHDLAGDILALPAVQRLIAERDEARAQVQRVREVADALDREGVVHLFHGPHNRNQFTTARIRRALDGPQHGDRPC